MDKALQTMIYNMQSENINFIAHIQLLGFIQKHETYLNIN